MGPDPTHVSADLRLFMPSPRTEEQRLLVQNVGESPATRLLFIAISGSEPGKLAGNSTATQSRAGLARRVRAGRHRTSRRRWPFPSSCCPIAT